MSTIPPPTDSTVGRIYRNYEKRKESFRTYLGASQIGNECERALWYGFRWAKKPAFDGRILRLFETGNLAEQRLADDLRATGAEVLEVDPDTGKQFSFDDLGGHMRGNMDGAGCGFTEAPATWHVIEYKTHNEKSFKALSKDGVQTSHPQHYDQMQTYMGWSGMARALYVAVNKNDDQLHIERIEFDKAHFERLRQKAKSIIFAEDPPERMNESPAFYKCKWCAFNSICHETGDIALSNCRTCKHSVAIEEGGWGCDLHGKILSKDDQERGCGDHVHREGMFAPGSAAKKVVDAFKATVIDEQELEDDEEIPF